MALWLFVLKSSGCDIIDNTYYSSARNYRGKCEVSGSGHIYQFQTSYANSNANRVVPREAVQTCKRRAASRWGVNNFFPASDKKSNIPIVFLF